jgi:muramidase (phage lysozyme)
MDNERPLGRGGTALRALIIPEGNPDNISTADILNTIGPNAVTFRALLLPEGAPVPPGYVLLGRYTAPTARQAARQRAATQGNQSDGRSSGSVQEASAVAQTAPRTMRRRPMPPTPSLANSPNDLTNAAMTAWQGLRDPALIQRVSDRPKHTADLLQNSVAKPESKPSDRRIEEARIRAFLKLLRYAENRSETDDPSVYSRMVGGGAVASLNRHPPTATVAINGQLVRSSIAGAYQISLSTWNEAVASLARQGEAIPDFSPASQDRVAREIIREHGAEDVIRQGRVEAAISLLNATWVSFPGGSQQARGLTLDEARRRFDNYMTEYMNQ